MKKLNMESLLPFIEEAFNRGLDFQIPITGTSMNPLLYQNRDFVKIVKPSLPLKIGDIPLYRRADGAFVLHRVVGIRENGEYIMCGDNQFILEHGITDNNIIGIAKVLIINGEEIDADTNSNYLNHKKKYISNVNTRYPVRRLRYKLHKLKAVFMGSPSEEAIAEAHNKSAEVNAIWSVGRVLVSAVRAGVKGEAFTFDEGTDFKKLFNLAQAHRITAFVAPLVMKSELADSTAKAMFSKELFRASARNTAQEKEREELSEAFSMQKIQHCFLKGSKVSAYYDNPDCRFMLDMDLYVQKEKFEQAEAILSERGYTRSSNSDDKDTAFTKPPFLIVELHKEIKYDYDKGYEYYKGAFERLVSEDGYALSMTDEDFYIYILSHTAHHFATSGTGIKSFIDHYYLNSKLKCRCNPELLKRGIEEIGLSEFSQKADALCDYWFCDAPATPELVEMEKFVFSSGVFGNETNGYISGVIRGEYGDKLNSYFLKRLLPPLKIMKVRYPVLNKLPLLLPAFWVVRFFTAIISPSKISEEAKTVSAVSNEEKENMKSFFKRMGL